MKVGEEFWSKYPHPRSRGDKGGTIKSLNDLPAEEQRKAIESIEPFKAVVAREQARNKDYAPPMAATYVNQRRWEGVLEASPGSVVAAPMVFPADPWLRKTAERLFETVGEPTYST